MHILRLISKQEFKVEHVCPSFFFFKRGEVEEVTINSFKGTFRGVRIIFLFLRTLVPQNVLFYFLKDVTGVTMSLCF